MEERAKEPFVLQAKEGERHALCMCGLSQKLPHCDGKHKSEPGKKPMVVHFKEKKRLFLCMCQQSKKFPYCDGSHQDC